MITKVARFGWLLLLMGGLLSPLHALPRPIGEDVWHEVGAGEGLYEIARHYGLAPQHLMWANAVSHRHPPKVGDRLLVPLRRLPPEARHGGLSIVLNLPEQILYLYRGGQVVRYWGVAIGEDLSPTPTGAFRILAKEKDPTWEPPAWMGKKPVPPGPNNPLGDRWMQITPNMVGIHGTNDPRTVGDVASLGCVRLYPEAARELYDLVAVGTPVHIVYEQVRVGQEPDGTLVWTFFPDPYHQWFPVFEAQKALERARSQGHEIELSDFEIEDAIPQTLGLLSPVFGRPVTVKRGDQVSRGKAYLKATGLWLDPEVLQTSGCTVTAAAGAKSAQISSTDGRAVVVTADPLPLNPQRTPKVLGQQPWRLEGHAWQGKIWVPFPLVLDYLQVPYRWDPSSAVLELVEG